MSNMFTVKKYLLSERNEIMKQKNLLIIMLVIITILSGCSSRPTDTGNSNHVNKVDENKITGCDFYYNIGNHMTEYIDIDKDKYFEIVYAIAGVARSTWYEGDNKFYTVADTKKEESYEYISNFLLDKSKYQKGYYNILTSALENVAPDRVSVILTDLQSDLEDYSKVSDLIVKNVLAKDLSVGIIGVQLDINESRARTFFVLAISDADNLSKYITNLKANPTIENYSGEKHDLQMDTVEMINYQIIANKSGIKNIKYDEIEYIENGQYVNKNGNIEVWETEGSFSEPNEDYREENMIKDIEGTVNFSPNVQRFVNINDSKEVRRSGGKSQYIGAQSLIYKKDRKNSEGIAGKLKLNIPFNVIEGVKLSKIDCEITTDVSVSKSGKFKPADADGITVTLAEGVNAEQGKWRIDNKTNSAVLNIMVPDLNKMPIDKGVVKLDITFKQRDTIQSVSNWVKDWDNRGCKNLLNLFDSIYTYQKDANTAENKLTVYLATGDEKATRRAAMGNAKERINDEEKGGNRDE